MAKVSGVYNIPLITLNYSGSIPSSKTTTATVSGYTNYNYYLYHSITGVVTWLDKNNTQYDFFPTNQTGGKTGSIQVLTTDTLRLYYSGSGNWQVKGYIAIPAVKSGNNGKPRELKDISQKSSITLFWVNIDNTRISETDEEKFIKSTISWQLDFVKSKWTQHTETLAAWKTYTMQWYWYIYYSAENITGTVWKLYINWTVVCKWGDANWVANNWLFFVKYWDILYIDTRASRDVIEIYDYY